MSNHINYFENSYYRNKHTNSNDFLNPISALSYGNIDPEIYLGYKNYSIKKLENNSLSNLLKSYLFALIELDLYLDTHPQDQNALLLHQEYSQNLKTILEKYQSQNYPLTIMFSNEKLTDWNYLKSWPWERGVK